MFLDFESSAGVEQIFQILIMVVIQTTHADTLAVTLRFPAHIAVLAAIVGLDCETIIGPKLPLGAETVQASPA